MPPPFGSNCGSLPCPIRRACAASPHSGTVACGACDVVSGALSGLMRRLGRALLSDSPESDSCANTLRMLPELQPTLSAGCQTMQWTHRAGGGACSRPRQLGGFPSGPLFSRPNPGLRFSAGDDTLRCSALTLAPRSRKLTATESRSRCSNNLVGASRGSLGELRAAGHCRRNGAYAGCAPPRLYPFARSVCVSWGLPLRGRVVGRAGRTGVSSWCLKPAAVAADSFRAPYLAPR